jgi:hypothetical protein
MTLGQSNYAVERTSPTWSTGVLSGLLLVTSVQTPGVAPAGVSQDACSYSVPQNSGTYSQFQSMFLQNMFTGEPKKFSSDFESTISGFYAALLAKQQPLGKEFEKVLYDNLWDLYVS